MTLRLKVLGGVSLTRDGYQVVGGAAQRRSLALLAVLAVHAERGITREKVAALLWPDSDESSARNNLKQALHVLRRELGAEAILGTTVLQLGRQAVAADVVEFEMALDRGDLEAAVACYHGPLLDGFHPGSPAAEFEPWVDGHRARLARQFREALEQLAGRATAGADHRTALRWWRRLSDLDPLDTTYARGVTRALLACDVTPQPSPARRVGGAEVQRPVGALGAQPPASRSFPFLQALAVAVPVVAAASFLALTVGGATGPLDLNRLVILTTSGETAAATEARLIANAVARRLSDAGVTTPVTEAGPGRHASVATRMGAGLALLISVDTSQGRVGSEAALIDTRTASHLWSIRAQAVDSPSTSRLADRAAAAAAARLDPRMRLWVHAASGPATVESYLEFRAGLDLYVEARTQDAEQRFRLATVRDPDFIMARIMTAWANFYRHNGQVSTSALAIADSVAAGDMPPLDRAMVEHQAAVFRSDYAAAYEKAERVVAAAPRSEWRYLLAESALQAGRGREAARILTNLNPETGWLQGRSLGYWIALQRALHLIGDHGREMEVLNRAHQRMPARDFSQLRVAALAASGQLGEVRQELDRSQAALGSHDPGRLLPLLRAVFELRAHGYPGLASRIAETGLEYFDRLPVPTKNAEGIHRVHLLIAVGNSTEAMRQLEVLSESDRSLAEVMAIQGVLAADLGDTAAARAVAANLRLRAETDSVGPDSEPDLLIGRAMVAVGLGEPDEAVRLLRMAYRSGFSWRIFTHWIWPFERLRGFAPYDELIRSID
jgi:DNA-binding SARP family transcriptional activator